LGPDIPICATVGCRERVRLVSAREEAATQREQSLKKLAQEAE
jgi:hypothetical protein